MTYWRLFDEGAKLNDLLGHLVGKIQAFTYVLLIAIVTFAVPFQIIG